MELAAGVGDTGFAAAKRLGPEGKHILMADPAAALAETRRVLDDGEARTRELLAGAGLEPSRMERRLKPYAEGDGYRIPGICLNVLAA